MTKGINVRKADVQTYHEVTSHIRTTKNAHILQPTLSMCHSQGGGGVKWRI